MARGFCRLVVRHWLGKEFLPVAFSTPGVRPDKKQIARIAALSRAALYDGRELTANARAKFRDSFLDLVDPDRQLPEAERQRRAEAARKAHYARLALKSAQKRRARKGGAE